MSSNTGVISAKKRLVLESDIPPMSDIVENNKTGLVIDPHDGRKWADAIIGLIKNPQEPEIRFAGMNDAMGNLVSGGIKERLTPFVDEADRKKLYMELVLRVSTRKDFDAYLGPVEYSASRRKKVIVLSFPLGIKYFLYQHNPTWILKKLPVKSRKFLGFNQSIFNSHPSQKNSSLFILSYTVYRVITI